MAGKYTKQGERKAAKYKRKRIPKAQTGITFPEEQPVPGALGTTKAGISGFGVGANLANKTGLSAAIPGAGLAAGAVGAIGGVTLDLMHQKEIKQENQRLKDMKYAYARYGDRATDPKLMKSKSLAKDGKQNTKRQLIEIEGKKDKNTGKVVGELMFKVDPKTKKYKLKAVGSKPHTKGGNKVIAEEGSVIFDTQGDSKEQEELILLASRANMGDEEAYIELEKRRSQLPEDKGEKKAEDGIQDVLNKIYGKGPGDDEDNTELAYDLYGDPIIDDDGNHLTKQEYDAQYESLLNQRESSILPTKNKKEPLVPLKSLPSTSTSASILDEIVQNKELQKTLDPDNSDYDDSLEERPISQQGSSRQTVQMKNEVSPFVARNNIEIGKEEYQDLPGYTNKTREEAIAALEEDLGRPLTNADIDNLPDGTYLDDDGLPVDKYGNEVSTPQQSSLFDSYAEEVPRGKMSKQEALDYIGSGLHDWSNDNLTEFMNEHGISYTEAKDYAVEHYDIDPDDFGKGITDKTTNIGPKTTDVFSRNYEPVAETPSAKLLQKEGIIMPTASGKSATGQKKDKKGGTDYKTRRKNQLPHNYWSDLDALADMTEQPEVYTPRNIDLEKMPFYDMSAPRIKEANKFNTVRQNNRRNMVASKGQHVAQAAQDEVAAQVARDRILAEETARHAGTVQQNVGIENQERSTNYNAANRADQINMQNRGAARNINRLGRSKMARSADRDIRTGYMMSRDEKLDSRDAMLYNLMRRSASPYYDFSEEELYTEDGNFYEDNDFEVKKEYKR